MRQEDLKFETLFVVLFFIWDKISLYSPGWHETHYVDQARLKLSHFCASQSAGIKDAVSLHHPAWDPTLFKKKKKKRRETR